jgi:hypothetical protein
MGKATASEDNNNNRPIIWYVLNFYFVSVYVYILLIPITHHLLFLGSHFSLVMMISHTVFNVIHR